MNMKIDGNVWLLRCTGKNGQKRRAANDRGWDQTQGEGTFYDDIQTGNEPLSRRAA